MDSSVCRLIKADLTLGGAAVCMKVDIVALNMLVSHTHARQYRSPCSAEANYFVRWSWAYLMPAEQRREEGRLGTVSQPKDS